MKMLLLMEKCEDPAVVKVTVGQACDCEGCKNDYEDPVGRVIEKLTLDVYPSRDTARHQVEEIVDSLYEGYNRPGGIALRILNELLRFVNPLQY